MFWTYLVRHLVGNLCIKLNYFSSPYSTTMITLLQIDHLEVTLLKNATRHATNCTLKFLQDWKSNSTLTLAGPWLAWVQWVKLHTQIFERTDFAPTYFEKR